ncbi:MAG: hypothetical protein CMJ78_05150 [Planctomycetaceae bacterium]|nr:hypothetical protein [Planctomycetaceae bacterium]
MTAADDQQALLRRVVWKLTDDGNDVRHALLDATDDFMALTAIPSAFPMSAQTEMIELRRELKSVQPLYTSHRSTSPLFDREGLGQPARLRARELAQRILALCKLVK